MTTESQVEVKEDKQDSREFGFTVMVKKDGDIQLTPHNLVNDFEFAGLVDYVVQKKADLMKTIGLSLETRTLQSVGMLAKALLQGTEKAKESDKPVG